MKKIILSLALGLLILPIFLPMAVSAENGEGPWNEYMVNFREETPLVDRDDLVALIFDAIRYVLAFLGVVAVVVIIIGGFMWMTAAGNDEKVGKAKKVIVQGIIGLIIVMFAFAIATFVINQLQSFGTQGGS